MEGKKLNNLKKLLFVVLVVTICVGSNVCGLNVNAATYTETGRTSIGGTEGYVISVNSHFYYKGSVGLRYGRIKSFNYDISRNRRAKKKNSHIEILSAKVTYGICGMTDTPKQYYQRSTTKKVYNRSGKITCPTYRNIYLDDGWIATCGANIYVRYKDKSTGKVKSTTVIANFPGVESSSLGRWNVGNR